MRSWFESFESPANLQRPISEIGGSRNRCPGTWVALGRPAIERVIGIYAN
jgi:hypothetical protein